MKAQLKFAAESILHSYAIVFFSQSKMFGCMLLVASLFCPAAGIWGLAGALISFIVCTTLNYHRESTRMGIYGFNTLLFGIGFGTFYQFNTGFLIWLLIGCFAVTLFSVTLAAFLAKHNFPLLSVPFVAGFWLLLLSANSVYPMGLQPKNSAVLNELFSNLHSNTCLLPGLSDSLIIPEYMALFFRALSAVIFQNSIIAGVIIALGLLIHSRIHFSLTVLAFITACLFNNLTGVYPDGISYYHLGANILMASGAIGCFFLIPSVWSYTWGLISIPVTILVINGLTRLFGFIELPVFSLPFCIVTFAFISFFRLRMTAGKLKLTPLQHYSPERNLYQFLNAEERLQELKYFKINLPFMGAWMVSQGYDGDITHKSAWGKAVDFVIIDDEAKTYKFPGIEHADFYCFNKPVLACADGTVEELTDHIDDNPIGVVNTVENWGNSVVIKHADGLYSQVSHLKKNSVKVKKGEFVKQGDVIGLCGNSGRSPEPHLHFQLQATPNIGSRTTPYPFAFYTTNATGKTGLCSFQTPEEGSIVSPLTLSRPVKQAFNLQPGYTAVLSAAGRQKEDVEVFTDAWNQTYLYSKATGATAYFINNGSMFYFTSFYGDRRSLLFYFYMAAYKIVFTAEPEVTLTDSFPLQVLINKPALWLHDLVAPFKQFIKLSYCNVCLPVGPDFIIQSSQTKHTVTGSKKTMEAFIVISGGAIKSFSINFNGAQTEVKWVSESVY